MKVIDPPPPTYAFGYKNPPQSGNDINGLGLEEKVQARHVFHNATGEDLPWNALDEFFSQINTWGVVRHMLANVWQLRRQEGPVAETQVDIDDPEAMAAEIKAEARRLGAGLVGIAPVTDEALYQGYQVPYRYAICLGLPMDREEMRHVPHERAAIEVMRAYREVARIAIELAQKIRAMGWPARAYGNPNSTEILHIPLAIRAGLGQLGKHGSIISREFGSNFRLAAVLTDLPLASDEPVDIGVEDLCLGCLRCVLDCPPGAIFNEKQRVRGEMKWYVDFDKCIPYFVKTCGCAICIEVCPWSEPGRGEWLSEKLLARRKRRGD
ncbi:MAG: 4Fe-4S dicluster domain-containing protein [Anaerolineae bacterium]